MGAAKSKSRRKARRTHFEEKSARVTLYGDELGASSSSVERSAVDAALTSLQDNRVDSESFALDSSSTYLETSFCGEAKENVRDGCTVTPDTTTQAGDNTETLATQQTSAGIGLCGDAASEQDDPAKDIAEGGATALPNFNTSPPVSESEVFTKLQTYRYLPSPRRRRGARRIAFNDPLPPVDFSLYDEGTDPRTDGSEGPLSDTILYEDYIRITGDHDLIRDVWVKQSPESLTAGQGSVSSTASRCQFCTNDSHFVDDEASPTTFCSAEVVSNTDTGVVMPDKSFVPPLSVPDTETSAVMQFDRPFLPTSVGSDHAETQSSVLTSIRNQNSSAETDACPVSPVIASVRHTSSTSDDIFLPALFPSNNTASGTKPTVPPTSSTALLDTDETRGACSTAESRRPCQRGTDETHFISSQSTAAGKNASSSYDYLKMFPSVIQSHETPACCDIVDVSSRLSSHGSVPVQGILKSPDSPTHTRSPISLLFGARQHGRKRQVSFSEDVELLDSQEMHEIMKASADVCTFHAKDGGGQASVCTASTNSREQCCHVELPHSQYVHLKRQDSGGNIHLFSHTASFTHLSGECSGAESAKTESLKYQSDQLKGPHRSQQRDVPETPDPFPDLVPFMGRARRASLDRLSPEQSSLQQEQISATLQELDCSDTINADKKMVRLFRKILGRRSVSSERRDATCSTSDSGFSRTEEAQDNSEVSDTNSGERQRPLIDIQPHYSSYLSLIASSSESNLQDSPVSEFTKTPSGSQNGRSVVDYGDSAGMMATPEFPSQYIGMSSSSPMETRATPDTKPRAQSCNRVSRCLKSIALYDGGSGRTKCDSSNSLGNEDPVRDGKGFPSTYIEMQNPNSSVEKKLSADVNHSLNFEQENGTVFDVERSLTLYSNQSSACLPSSQSNEGKHSHNWYANTGTYSDPWIASSSECDMVRQSSNPLISQSPSHILISGNQFEDVQPEARACPSLQACDSEICRAEADTQPLMTDEQLFWIGNDEEGDSVSFDSSINPADDPNSSASVSFVPARSPSPPPYASQMSLQSWQAVRSRWHVHLFHVPGEQCRALSKLHVRYVVKNEDGSTSIYCQDVDKNEEGLVQLPFEATPWDPEAPFPRRALNACPHACHDVAEFEKRMRRKTTSS